MQLRSSVPILVAGVGIGILSGLSASPVIQVVIAAIIAAACGVIAALAGLARREDGQTDVPVLRRVKTVPMMVLTIGVVVGALIGVRARTSNWLGNGTAEEVRKWEKTGLPEAERYRRLFDHEYPPYMQTTAKTVETNEKPSEAASSQDFRNGVLFSGEVENLVASCTTLMLSSPSDMQKRLLLTGDKRIARYAAALTDPQLKHFVKDFLCAEK
jgi:hypothetical protein